MGPEIVLHQPILVKSAYGYAINILRTSNYQVIIYHSKIKNHKCLPTYKMKCNQEYICVYNENHVRDGKTHMKIIDDKATS